MWFLLACVDGEKPGDNATDDTGTGTTDTGSSLPETCTSVPQIDEDAATTGVASGFLYCYTEAYEGSFVREAAADVVTDAATGVYACNPGEGVEPACLTDADCATGAVCGASTWMYGLDCACYSVCLSDADCDTGFACVPRAAHAADDGWTRAVSWRNECLPAECRSAADCGGAECRASPDMCQYAMEGLACATDTDECARDSDCTARTGGGNDYCGYDGLQWSCMDYAACD